MFRSSVAGWQSSSFKFSDGHSKVLVKFDWVQLKLLGRHLELTSALYYFIKAHVNRNFSVNHTFYSLDQMSLELSK